MLELLLSLAYYLTFIIHLCVGFLGMCYPFGILGDYTPFYSPQLGIDITELMTVHLARMCQVNSFFIGLLFFMLRNESKKVRSLLVLSVNLAAVVFSLGEMYLDAPRAVRLGIDITPSPTATRSVQFLVGCLDGGSFGTLVLSTFFVTIALTTLAMPQKSAKLE
mmetsp:Transcript_15211/g.23819  ORF Transcript_15211/g.23819 Transcript_15211/m.23819 type:complete len:164 (-) Transcript_15211:53-544(-)